MKRKEKIENYKREEIFAYYDAKTCPFVVMNTKIDITNLAKYCKKQKHHYATIGWALVMAVNQVYEMRVRNEKGKFYLYDKMNAEFVFPFDNGVIGYFCCQMKDDYKEFIETYDKTLNEFKSKQESILGKDDGEIWLSCEPWMELNSIQVPFDKNNSIQQFIWDKIQKNKGRYYINLSIMFHHGYLDGVHVGQFLENLNKIISNFG